MNQKGKVQPIGGVNQKIEGYYKTCKIKGLNGKQGVIIPEQNKDNLMLKDEVIKAVKNDEFHIYSIEDIDEAIELMFNKPAKEVHEKVNEVLKDIAEKASQFGSEEGDD